MKRKRYTEEQIAFALRQAESGTSVADVVRKMGISEQTFYRWKRKQRRVVGPAATNSRGRLTFGRSATEEDAVRRRADIRFSCGGRLKLC